MITFDNLLFAHINTHSHVNGKKIQLVCKQGKTHQFGSVTLTNRALIYEKTKEVNSLSLNSCSNYAPILINFDIFSHIMKMQFAHFHFIYYENQVNAKSH